MYKYDTEDATIIQYYLNGETRNISIIPKVKETLEENPNAGIFEQENYFLYPPPLACIVMWLSVRQ